MKNEQINKYFKVPIVREMLLDALRQYVVSRITTQTLPKSLRWISAILSAGCGHVLELRLRRRKPCLRWRLSTSIHVLSLSRQYGSNPSVSWNGVPETQMLSAPLYSENVISQPLNFATQGHNGCGTIAITLDNYRRIRRRHFPTLEVRTELWPSRVERYQAEILSRICPNEIICGEITPENCTSCSIGGTLRGHGDFHHE